MAPTVTPDVSQHIYTTTGSINTIGNFTSVTFTKSGKEKSGKFIPNINMNIGYLVVGGGGHGWPTGMGGAGGGVSYSMLSTSNVVLKAGNTYIITVGDGRGEGDSDMGNSFQSGTSSLTGVDLFGNNINIKASGGVYAFLEKDHNKSSGGRASGGSNNLVGGYGSMDNKAKLGTLVSLPDINLNNTYGSGANGYSQNNAGIPTPNSGNGGHGGTDGGPTTLGASGVVIIYFVSTAGAVLNVPQTTTPGFVPQRTN